MSPADAVFFNAQGALVFGAFVSTLLTLVVIPILYHVAESRTLARACAAPTSKTAMEGVPHDILANRSRRRRRFNLLSLALGVPGSPLFHSRWWLVLTAFTGVSLLQSGLSKRCLMERGLPKLATRSGA